jgi:hypothetical protein
MSPALKLNRYDAATYNNLAWLYAKSSDKTVRNLDRAEEYAKKAEMLTGGKGLQILDTLAQILFLKGGEADRERAVSLLRTAIDFAPNAERKRYQERLKELFPNEPQ